MQLSELHRKTRHPKEAGWHIIVAVLIAIGLELVLSDKITFGTKDFVAGLEFVFLLLLTIFRLRPVAKRLFAILLLGLISFANIVSLFVVISALFGNVGVNGHDLIISSLAIYVTNIIVFGLWYWELDNTRVQTPDFLFPQQTKSGLDDEWRPMFFDYLYISVTNATAFSPTDTLPLTHRAKLLMLIQSVTSLVTIALVVSRAVNILN
jgi:uncharacterized membrane protein